MTNEEVIASLPDASLAMEIAYYEGHSQWHLKRCTHCREWKEALLREQAKRAHPSSGNRTQESQ